MHSRPAKGRGYPACAQKSSQHAHSGCDYLLESFETTSDEVTSLDNDEQHMSIENVNQKALFQSLYELLLHLPDVVLVLSDMAEKIIRELNGRNLAKGVLPPEMGEFTTEYSKDIGMEVDKDTFTPTCVATVPEKSHYSHLTGFRVSIAGGIKVKFMVDIIALKNHPTEITNALHPIVYTTCEEMTLITASKLMANEGHAQVGEKKKQHEDVACKPLCKKRHMLKCNECCTM